MPEGTAEPAQPPSAATAREWIGFEIDDLGGTKVGRVHGFFADAGSAEPAWLIASVGRRRPRLRRRPARLVAIPLRDCAGGGGRVWTAHERAEIGTAPMIDPTRPLLREHEIAICSHYGIGEQIGRHAEVAGCDEGSVTARPA